MGKQQILADVFVEQVRRLLAEANDVTHGVGRQLSRLGAADAVAAGVVKEAHQNVGEGRFPGARRALDDNTITATQAEVEAAESEAGFSRPGCADPGELKHRHRHRFGTGGDLRLSAGARQSGLGR